MVRAGAPATESSPEPVPSMARGLLPIEAPGRLPVEDPGHPKEGKWRPRQDSNLRPIP